MKSYAACLKLYDLTMKSSTVLVKLVSRDLFSKACSQNIVKQTQYHIHLVIWHFSKAMWSHIFIGFCHCSFKWISANRFPCSSILMTLAAFLFSYIIFPLWLFWILQWFICWKTELLYLKKYIFSLVFFYCTKIMWCCNDNVSTCSKLAVFHGLSAVKS